MTKKNVKVDIPKRKPDTFITLLTAVLKRHTELGVQSPLNNINNVDMNRFSTLLSGAIEDREESIRLRGLSQAKMEKARIQLGTNAGQGVNTEDTLYFFVTLIRDYLLLTNPGRPEQLSIWGFDVVVAMAKLPKRKGDDSEETPEA